MANIVLILVLVEHALGGIQIDAEHKLKRS